MLQNKFISVSSTDWFIIIAVLIVVGKRLLNKFRVKQKKASVMYVDPHLASEGPQSGF